MKFIAKKLSVIAITIALVAILLWQITGLIRSDMSPPQAVISDAPTHKPHIKKSMLVSEHNKKARVREVLYLDMIERYRFAKLQRDLLQEELAIANLQQQISVIKHNSYHINKRDISLNTVQPRDSNPVQAKVSASVLADTPHKKTATSPIKNTPTQPIAKQQQNLDEAVLLAMPASSYTIRLLSSENPDELLQFAKQHHMNGRTLCYADKKDNHTTVYTLLYGDYLTKEAAQSALASLPQALNLSKATIETLANIQKTLRSTK